VKLIQAYWCKNGGYQIFESCLGASRKRDRIRKSQDEFQEQPWKRDRGEYTLGIEVTLGEEECFNDGGGRDL